VTGREEGESKRAKEADEQAVCWQASRIGSTLGSRGMDESIRLSTPQRHAQQRRSSVGKASPELTLGRKEKNDKVAATRK
jgi:hypothetical protein